MQMVALSPSAARRAFWITRGPVYEMKGGMMVLAQISGRPVLPISWEYSRAWRLKSWDRFMIPKPFSRVILHIGEPYFVPRNVSPDTFE